MEVVSFTPLPPGKEPPVPIGYDAGWAPEAVWTLWIRENLALPGIESRLSRPSLYRLLADVIK
jgi:hypothetical protein